MRVAPTRRQLDRAATLTTCETEMSVNEFVRLDRLGPRRPLPRPADRPLRKGERLLLLMQRYERGEQLFHPAER